MSKDTQVQDDVMALLSSTASHYAKDSARDIGPKKKTKEELQKKQQEIVAKLTATKEDNIENCTKCGKHVYLAEKREVDFKEGKAIFHKNCFRCTECNVKLELSSFASVNRTIYCKTHVGAAHQKFNASQAPALGADKNSNTEGYSEISNKMSKLSVDNSEACGVCGKTVYLAEKLEIEIKGKKKNFHKSCFKCSSCGISLTIRNYGSLDAVLYCQTHLKENQPKMTKGEFFVSPLKKPETQGATPTGLIVEQELRASASAQEEDDDSKPIAKSQHKPEKEELKSKEEERKAKEPEPVEDEEEKRRREREERRRKRQEETSSTSSTNVSSSSSSESIEEDEVARRQRERDERRKQRELAEAKEEQERAERRRQKQSGSLEASSEQQESPKDNAAEEREKRRIERQKRLEEEAKKEAEENERKIQERRKRIEALKSQS